MRKCEKDEKKINKKTHKEEKGQKFTEKYKKKGTENDKNREQTHKIETQSARVTEILQKVKKNYRKNGKMSRVSVF